MSPSIDNVLNALVELQIVLKILRRKTIDLLRVIIKLIILSRDVKSRLCTAYSDAGYDTVNQLKLIAFVLS